RNQNSTRCTSICARPTASEAGTCTAQKRRQPRPAVRRPSQPSSGTSAIHSQKLPRFQARLRSQFGGAPSLIEDSPPLSAYDSASSVQKPKISPQVFSRCTALRSDTETSLAYRPMARQCARRWPPATVPEDIARTPALGLRRLRVARARLLVAQLPRAAAVPVGVGHAVGIVAVALEREAVEIAARRDVLQRQRVAHPAGRGVAPITAEVVEHRRGEMLGGLVVAPPRIREVAVRRIVHVPHVQPLAAEFDAERLAGRDRLAVREAALAVPVP